MERLKKQWVNFQWSDHSYYNTGFKSTVNKCLQAEKQNFCKLDHCYHSFSAEKEAIEDAVAQKFIQNQVCLQRDEKGDNGAILRANEKNESTSENKEQINESPATNLLEVNTKENIKSFDKSDENDSSYTTATNTRKFAGQSSSPEGEFTSKEQQPLNLACRQSPSPQKESLSDLSNTSPELLSPKCVQDDNFFCDKNVLAKDDEIISRSDNDDNIVIPLMCKFSKKRVDHNYCDRGNKKARKESLELRKNDHTYIRRPRALSCDFPSRSADTWKSVNVEIEQDEVPHSTSNCELTSGNADVKECTNREIPFEKDSLQTVATYDVLSKHFDDEQSTNVQINVDVGNFVSDCEFRNHGVVSENNTNIELEVEVTECDFITDHSDDTNAGLSTNTDFKFHEVTEAATMVPNVTYCQLQNNESNNPLAIHNNAAPSQSISGSNTIASSNNPFAIGNDVQNQNVRQNNIGSDPNLLLQSIIEGQSPFNLAFGSSGNVATAIPINPQSMPNLNLQDLPTTGITLTPFRIPVPILSPLPSLFFQPSLLSLPNFQSSASLEQVKTLGTISCPMPILNIPAAGDLFTTASNLRPMTLERRENSMDNQSTQSNASMESMNETNRDNILPGDCVNIRSTADNLKPSVDGDNQGNTHSFYFQDDVESFEQENIIIEETPCDSSDLNLITASLATSQINTSESDIKTEIKVKLPEKSSSRKKSSANIDKVAKSIQKRTVKVAKASNPFAKPVETSRYLIQAVMTDHTYEVDKVSGQKMSIEKDHCYKKKSENDSTDCATNLMDYSEDTLMEIHNIDHNYVPAL